jgi:4-amino-4-deoxy-L-arabinose transferase-like glycosyltransferase
MTRNKIQDLWSEYKWLLSDIRFWIGVFFMLRLIGIINAPLEMGHNWRQSLTAMIARNFWENGANLLYPAIDLAGEKTGIIGSEFPLFNYLIYIVAEVFGYQHWYGRLINLVVTTIGTFYFYKSTKAILSHEVAYYATLILTVSVWFGFSRKIMPDTFSVSLMLIGLYHAHQFLSQTNKGLSLLWFFIFCTLGMLCKIPALSLLSVLGVAVFMPSVKRSRTARMLLAGSLGFAITCIWYFYWVPYLVTTYGYELYFPRTMSEGLREIMELWPQLLEKFYFVAFSSFIGFACFITGCFAIFRTRHTLKWHLLGFGIVSIVFGLFIIKTGLVFPLHSYYIVPYVPIMALIAGYFLAHIKPKYATWLMVIISIEAIGNHQDDFFIKQREKYKLNLERITEKYIPKSQRIIINGGPSPQLIYFAHRKGWTEESTVLLQHGHIDSLHHLGATHLIWHRRNNEQPPAVGPTLYQDQYFHIQRITP